MFKPQYNARHKKLKESLTRCKNGRHENKAGARVRRSKAKAEFLKLLQSEV